MRKDIYNMFNVYESDFQYHMNKVILAGFESFGSEMEKAAGHFKVKQTVEDKNIFWFNDDDEYEAMFAFIIDSTDIDRIIDTYKIIKAKSIPITFAIIEQIGDGKHQYDIFCLSQRSYMEHCNRAYAPGTSCDE